MQINQNADFVNRLLVLIIHFKLKRSLLKPSKRTIYSFSRKHGGYIPHFPILSPKPS